MHSLNVTHVVPYFTPAWAYGGIPRLAYELAREEARMGHHVRVITTDALDSTHRHPESGLTIRLDDGLLKARYLRNVSNKLAYFDQLFMPVGMREALRDLAADADVIHIHGHRHMLEVMAAEWADKRSIPYIMTANGTAPRIERRVGIKSFLDGVRFDAILKNATACIAVAEAEIQQYTERGVARERISVIPNGMDVNACASPHNGGDFRKTWNIPDAPIVLYLGKVTPRKGLVPLLGAVDLIRKKRPVTMVVAGNDMGFMNQVKAESARRNMNDCVVYTGLVTGRDKKAAYSAASVTVYPSQFEIFGLVPFESIMCGTPVVVSDDSGCGEIVGRERIGEIVPYGDEVALAAAIEKVIDNPDESRERVERGRRFIASSLDWKVVAAQTIDLYRKAIKAKSGSKAT